MKKTFKFWAYGAAMLALAPLASCSNEEAVSLPEFPTAPEGYSNIVLSIDGLTGTRADEKTAPVTETTIKDLWFCAFPTDDSPTAEKLVVNLFGTTDADFQSPIPTSWDKYKSVQLKNGKYHVYVLANVNDYLTTAISPSSSESDITGIELKFANSSDNGLVEALNAPVATQYLPMLCKNTEMQTSPTTQTSPATTLSDGVLTVSGDIYLYANLTLLVSKVRYTILFDLDTYSKEIYDATDVDFTQTNVANNVRKTTKYTAENPTASTFYLNNVSIPLDKRAYPTTDLGKYTSITSQDTPPADLGTTNVWTEAATTHQRAWQGMVYLPENAVESNSGQTLKTQFVFTPNPGANLKSGVHNFDLKLERGHFYDVVMQLTKEGQSKYDVRVYAKVKPWVYDPSIVDTW